MVFNVMFSVVQKSMLSVEWTENHIWASWCTPVYLCQKAYKVGPVTSCMERTDFVELCELWYKMCCTNWQMQGTQVSKLERILYSTIRWIYRLVWVAHTNCTQWTYYGYGRISINYSLVHVVCKRKCRS